MEDQYTSYEGSVQYNYDEFEKTLKQDQNQINPQQKQKILKNHKEYKKFFFDIQHIAEEVIEQRQCDQITKASHKLVLIDNTQKQNRRREDLKSLMIFVSCQHYGSIMNYNVITTSYKLSLKILNINLVAPEHLYIIGEGNFGRVFKIKLKDEKHIVIKRIKTIGQTIILNKKKEEVTIEQKVIGNRIQRKQINRVEWKINGSRHIFTQIVNQYTIYKICSFFRIGPRIFLEIGFDIICFQNAFQFYMQACDQITQTSEKFQQQIKVCIKILHNIKIIHKDIKPSNMLFSRYYNKYVLSDFGISHVIQENIGQLTATYKEGTGYYMSKQMSCIKYGEMKKIDLYHNDYFGFKTSLNDFLHNKIEKLHSQNSKKFKVDKIYMSIVLFNEFLTKQWNQESMFNFIWQNIQFIESKIFTSLIYNLEQKQLIQISTMFSKTPQRFYIKNQEIMASKQIKKQYLRKKKLFQNLQKITQSIKLRLQNMCWRMYHYEFLFRLEGIENNSFQVFKERKNYKTQKYFNKDQQSKIEKIKEKLSSQQCCILKNPQDIKSSHSLKNKKFFNLLLNQLNGIYKIIKNGNIEEVMKLKLNLNFSICILLTQNYYVRNLSACQKAKEILQYIEQKNQNPTQQEREITNFNLYMLDYFLYQEQFIIQQLCNIVENSQWLRYKNQEISRFIYIIFGHLIITTSSCGNKLIKFYQKILKEDISILKPEILGIIYQNIGLMYYNMQKYEQALLNYRIALKYPNSKKNSHLLYNIGIAYQQKGQYQKALQNFQESRKILNKLQNQEELPSIYYCKGICYMQLNQYQKSLDCFKQSLILKNKFGDNFDINSLYINEEIAKLYLLYKQYGLAIKYLDDAIYLSFNIDYKNIDAIKNRLYNLMAEIYFQQGNYQDSIAILHQQMKQHFNHYNLVSKCYFMKNQYQTAIKYLLLGSYSNKQIINIRQILISHYAKQKKREFLKLFKKIRNIYINKNEENIQIKNNEYLEDCINGLGEWYMTQKKYETSYYYFNLIKLNNKANKIIDLKQKIEFCLRKLNQQNRKLVCKYKNQSKINIIKSIKKINQFLIKSKMQNFFNLDSTISISNVIQIIKFFTNIKTFREASLFILHFNQLINFNNNNNELNKLLNTVKKVKQSRKLLQLYTTSNIKYHIIPTQKFLDLKIIKKSLRSLLKMKLYHTSLTIKLKYLKNMIIKYL